MAEVNDLVVRGSATVSSMKVVGNTSLLGNTNLEGEATVGSMKVVGNTNLEGETTVNDIKVTNSIDFSFPDNTDTIKYLMDFVYPVGSYFITHSSYFSSEGQVNDYFGGEWIKVGDGYFLEACESGAGGTMEAGLPNITGNFKVNGIQNSSQEFLVWLDDGNKNSFTSSDPIQYTRPVRTVMAYYNDRLPPYYQTLNFNASKCFEKSVYKDSCTTVQPQSRKVYIYYRDKLFRG